MYQFNSIEICTFILLFSNCGNATLRETSAFMYEPMQVWKEYYCKAFQDSCLQSVSRGLTMCDDEFQQCLTCPLRDKPPTPPSVENIRNMRLHLLISVAITVILCHSTDSRSRSFDVKMEPFPESMLNILSMSVCRSTEYLKRQGKV